MFKRVDFNEAERMFRDYGRQDQFSREGLRALVDHLEQIEEDTGESIEFDVVGLCCDFCEYDDRDEFKAAYDEDLREDAFICELPNGSILARSV